MDDECRGELQVGFEVAQPPKPRLGDLPALRVVRNGAPESTPNPASAMTVLYSGTTTLSGSPKVSTWTKPKCTTSRKLSTCRRANAAMSKTGQVTC
jgi:hypothetical protein